MEARARAARDTPTSGAAEAAAEPGPDAGVEPRRSLSQPRRPRPCRRDLRRRRHEARASRSAIRASSPSWRATEPRLAEAIAAYESLSDTIGRLGSYAGLLYAADTSDPENAKFYGDIQEKLTAITTDLIFFELELNKIDEAALARALQVPALARYKPWIDDLRKEKPYQLEEKLERLFHEKAITARGAWNRLFNETMTGAALRGGGRGGAAGARADAQLPDAPRRAQAAGRGRGAGQGVQGQRRVCSR